MASLRGGGGAAAAAAPAGGGGSATMINPLNELPQQGTSPLHGDGGWPLYRRPDGRTLMLSFTRQLGEGGNEGVGGGESSSSSSPPPPSSHQHGGNGSNIPKANESSLMFIAIVVGLICLFYLICTLQCMRIWLCQKCRWCGGNGDGNGGGDNNNAGEGREGRERGSAADTVLVHQGRVFNLSGDQRRAVLEAIFSETSKAATDNEISKKRSRNRRNKRRCRSGADCNRDDVDVGDCCGGGVPQDVEIPGIPAAGTDTSKEAAAAVDPPPAVPSGADGNACGDDDGDDTESAISDLGDNDADIHNPSTTTDGDCEMDSTEEGSLLDDNDDDDDDADDADDDDERSMPPSAQSSGSPGSAAQDSDNIVTPDQRSPAESLENTKRSNSSCDISGVPAMPDQGTSHCAAGFDEISQSRSDDAPSAPSEPPLKPRSEPTGGLDLALSSMVNNPALGATAEKNVASAGAGSTEIPASEKSSTDQEINQQQQHDEEEAPTALMASPILELSELPTRSRNFVIPENDVAEEETKEEIGGDVASIDDDSASGGGDNPDRASLSPTLALPYSLSRRGSFTTAASEFTFDDDSATTMTDNVCPICLCGYSKGDILVSSKYCTHSFHKECILEWLQKHNDCPVCRQGMVTDSELNRAATSVMGKTRMYRAVATMRPASSSTRNRDQRLQQPNSTLMPPTRRVGGNLNRLNSP